MIMRIAIMLGLITCFINNGFMIILLLVVYAVYWMYYFEKRYTEPKITVNELTHTDEELLSTVEEEVEGAILVILSYYTFDYTVEWCVQNYKWNKDYSYRIVNCVNKKYLLYESH